MVSPTRDNVRFVPDRNVRLTRSAWGGEQTRRTDYDAAGQRPAGGAKEGAEETDQEVASGQGVGHFTAAGAAAAEASARRRGPGGGTCAAGAALEPEAEFREARESDHSNVPGGLPGIRADLGQRVFGKQARCADRPRGVTADHDAGGSVAGAAPATRASAPMARATELSWGTGAVGYQRARLAGRARGEAVSDSHDRRRDERVDVAVRGARLDGGEHAAVVEIPGTAG